MRGQDNKNNNNKMKSRETWRTRENTNHALALALAHSMDKVIKWRKKWIGLYMKQQNSFRSEIPRFFSLLLVFISLSLILHVCNVCEIVRRQILFLPGFLAIRWKDSTLFHRFNIIRGMVYAAQPLITLSIAKIYKVATAAAATTTPLPNRNEWNKCLISNNSNKNKMLNASH